MLPVLSMWPLRRRAGPERASLYTYVTPPPTMTSLNPTSGTTLGGTTVTITGTNLTGASAVTIGGLPATTSIVNATTITAVTPAHAAGIVDVAVTTAGGATTGTGSTPT